MRHSECTASDDGASAVEYGLLVVAIAATLAVIVFVVGGYVRGSFQGACDDFEAAGATNASASGNDCDS
jgi:pilus assembly protein Flp/PilA